MLAKLLIYKKRIHDLWDSGALDFVHSFVQNKGAVIGVCIIAFYILVAIFAPFLAPHSPEKIFTGQYTLPPLWMEGGTSQFIFGTDDLGRCLLSRLIFGARISVGVGFMVALFAFFVGTILGLVSGYFGGWVDQVIMRVTDLLMSLPSILLSIVVVVILGPGIFNAVIAVAIVKIPNFIRLVRASTMAEKNKEYIVASRTFGASHLRQIFINIFPNILAPLVVQTTLTFSDGILDIAALGFLGLGAQPPTPEWGTMLSDAKNYFIAAPWFVIMPGLCILFVVLGFNLLGDGIRDAFDPRLKK
ncbi:MAG: ABC transporter permease subunit [Bdellovibrionales bacterium]|nr:ABC transporter permease subunit [Bdellovibrionales bacterium]